jgi:hypothetical protein
MRQIDCIRYPILYPNQRILPIATAIAPPIAGAFPMAISQARMNAIIDAASDAQNKLLHLRNAIIAAMSADDINEAMRHLTYEVDATTPLIEHVQCIASERAHFKRHMHKNNRDAARLRMTRGMAKPEDHSYTASIIPAPARANGPRARATYDRQRTTDQSLVGTITETEIAAAFARAYSTDEIARALDHAPATPIEQLTIKAPTTITDEAGNILTPSGKSPDEPDEDQLEL